MKRFVLLGALLAALVVAGGASGKDRGPRCAIKDPEPPSIVGAKSEAYLWAEVKNRCLDPVAEMGTYACLVELEFAEGPSRIIACHANIDRPVLLVPHETNVYIAALCDYTTIPRIYKTTAYAWSIGLDQQRFQSPKMTSGGYGRAKTSGGTKRFCHVSKKDVEWRRR